MVKGKKNWQGISVLPIFDDMAVYEFIKEIAHIKTMRPYSLMLEAAQTMYKEVTGNDLNVNDIKVMHRQLSEASDKKGVKANKVTGFIEWACNRYIHQYYKNRLPKERQA